MKADVVGMVRKLPRTVPETGLIYARVAGGRRVAFLN